jgi:hypothetical protein
MHHSEWLDQAQRVPVGQKRRVYHGAERTPAMDVWNNDDSWSAYCHRCHESARVSKGYIEKLEEVQEVEYLNVNDIVSLDVMRSKHIYWYKVLVQHLHAKGVSTTIIEPYRPMFNTKDKRLVFRLDGTDIGRDLTGKSVMKWRVYRTVKGYVYLQGKDSIVLCEDLYSSMKVHHYTGKSVMCLLGTGINDAKINKILSTENTVNIMLDGDDAGRDGTSSITKRLSSLGIPFKVIEVLEGNDPKDLKPIELVRLLNG